MGNPLSKDLRERVIAAWKANEPWTAIAERFKVSVPSVNRWIRRYRATGSVLPAPHGGGQSHRISDDQLQVLRGLVDAQPDQTIAELRERFADKTGLRVGTATIGRALARLGLTRKKKQSGRRA